MEEKAQKDSHGALERKNGRLGALAGSDRGIRRLLRHRSSRRFWTLRVAARIVFGALDLSVPEVYARRPCASLPSGRRLRGFCLRTSMPDRRDADP